MSMADGSVEIEVVQRRTLAGRLKSVLKAMRPDDHISDEVDTLTLEFGGIPGDRHFGHTRKSGSREPWYPRGTEIRSGREVTVVSVEELAEIAGRMGLENLPAGWIGANLVVEGVPNLTFLPPGTRLFLEGGGVLVVEAVNNPCRIAGKVIAREAGRDDLELMFPKVAMGLRGVVASVERAATVRAGTAVEVRVPEQRVYR
jgi:hypothetical protein